MTAFPTPPEFQSKWKTRFFTIWSGQALSLVGSALVQFALVWWLTIKTGSAIAGVILSAWRGFKRRIVTSLSGVIGVGLGVVLFGLAPADLFFLLLIAGFLQGCALVFANGPLQAIFQSAIAPDMQGRVFSLIGAGAAAMMPLSLLIAGPVADWLGVRFWYTVGGTICILVTVVASFIPTIMNIERNQGSAQGVLAPD